MLVISGVAFVFAFIAMLERSNRPSRSTYTRCSANIRNVVLGVLAYENRIGHFPDGMCPNDEIGPAERLSWYAAVLPDLDEQERFNVLEMDQPWDVGENDELAHSRIRVLSCPERAAVAAGSPEPASYIGIAGLGVDAPSLPKSDRRAGVFGYERQAKLADIKDGTAQTMMLVETGRFSGSWLQAGPATVRGLDPAQKPCIGPGRQFGGMHRGGAFVAFADGSVRRVSESVDPAVFEALSTMAGGERLPPDLLFDQ
jgi:prepilin-type processing-associated H-X9-DG protein